MSGRQNATSEATDAPVTQLMQAAESLGVSLSAVQCAKLLTYVELLAKWNSVYNLTAVRDPQEMITRHILDSLSVAPYIKGPLVLDIGTGAGLPGIPLAVAFPDIQFTLLDSVAKKTRFVLQAVGELGLSNVMVKTGRVEKYQPPQLFDTVISRAFSSISDFLNMAGSLCRPGGALLAMKGRYPEEELADLPPDFQVDDILRLRVPGLDEERHAARLSRHYAFDI